MTIFFYLVLGDGEDFLFLDFFMMMCLSLGEDRSFVLDEVFLALCL